jgi:2-polyprenyl-6-hydroxyphenyl methylase/3-demethylubiquinone-9 3-methyltransferase
MSVTEYYDQYWTAEGFNPEDGSGSAHPQVEEIVRRRVTDGSDALDLGCGNGRVGGPLLTRYGAGYIGVDISRTAVAAARDFGLDARVIDDVAKLPFDSNSFDFVLCIEVLEHLFRPDLAAREIGRVLRPGGTALVTVPNVAYWRRRADMALFGRWVAGGDHMGTPWRDPHIRFFSLSALQRMLEDTGFAPVEVAGHGGAVLRDLPVLRVLDRGHSSQLYKRVERIAPSLLSTRLHAVATSAA